MSIQTGGKNMSSSKYELTAIVEREQLPDLLEQVELISLKELEELGKEPKVDKKLRARNFKVQLKVRTRTSKYRTASRFKGSLTGEELITKLMSDGRIRSASEIKKMFLEQGFGHNSSSPRISGMVKRGELIM